MFNFLLRLIIILACFARTRHIFRAIYCKSWPERSETEGAKKQEVIEPTWVPTVQNTCIMCVTLVPLSGPRLYVLASGTTQPVCSLAIRFFQTTVCRSYVVNMLPARRSIACKFYWTTTLRSPPAFFSPARDGPNGAAGKRKRGTKRFVL